MSGPAAAVDLIIATALIFSALTMARLLRGRLTVRLIVSESIASDLRSFAWDCAVLIVTLISLCGAGHLGSGLASLAGWSSFPGSAAIHLTVAIIGVVLAWHLACHVSVLQDMKLDVQPHGETTRMVAELRADKQRLHSEHQAERDRLVALLQSEMASLRASLTSRTQSIDAPRGQHRGPRPWPLAAPSTRP